MSPIPFALRKNSPLPSKFKKVTSVVTGLTHWIPKLNQQMVNAIAHLIESRMSATLASCVRSRPPKRTHNSMVYSCGIYSLRRRQTKPPVPCLAAMQSMVFTTCFTIQHWHIYWSKRSCLFELHHMNTHISRVHPWANNRWWIIQSELVLCFCY